VKRLLLCTPALAAVSAAAVAATAATDAPAATGTRPVDGITRKIEQHRRATLRLQRLMGRRPVRTTYSARRSSDREYRRWLLDVWRRRHVRARRAFRRPPHRAAWRCIQRHEAPWHDPGAPYYGGLQMDLAFQRLYGADLLRRKGTANKWTPLEQMWVAERALRAGRGFYPWPNTARACGLL
jgi:hypothetical protein